MMLRMGTTVTFTKLAFDVLTGPANAGIESSSENIFSPFVM